MKYQWFKFYGGEYLSDPKIFGLTIAERSCWITLLCLASISSEPGKIFFVTEEQLMLMSGIRIDNNYWNETKGVLKRFENMNMIDQKEGFIEIKNYKKRQEGSLTEAERKAIQRAREKDGVQTSVRTMSKESRVDKNRTSTSSVNISSNLLTDDKKEYTDEEWVQYLKSWKKKGGQVIRGMKLIIKKDQSRWLVDQKGQWNKYKAFSKHD